MEVSRVHQWHIRILAIAHLFPGAMKAELVQPKFPASCGHLQEQAESIGHPICGCSRLGLANFDVS